MAIYGAGGFGRETAVMIAQINAHQPSWELLGFFDDGHQKGDMVDGLSVLGGMDVLNSFASELSVCVAVAEPQVRAHLVERIVNPRVTFPALVHPQASGGDVMRNKMHRGSIITAGVILTTGIELGEFSILNLSSTIGHDVRLGAYCTVMPACSVSGNVSVGPRTLLGTGSRIVQGVEIGADCLVGAGAVVTKSFANNLKIMGVPARGFKS